jgi:hypothetical protein
MRTHRTGHVAGKRIGQHDIGGDQFDGLARAPANDGELRIRELHRAGSSPRESRRRRKSWSRGSVNGRRSILRRWAWIRSSGDCGGDLAGTGRPFSGRTAGVGSRELYVGSGFVKLEPARAIARFQPARNRGGRHNLDARHNHGGARRGHTSVDGRRADTPVRAAGHALSTFEAGGSGTFGIAAALSLPQACEVLNTREGRNPGMDATQSCPSGFFLRDPALST